MYEICFDAAELTLSHRPPYLFVSLNQIARISEFIKRFPFYRLHETSTILIWWRFKFLSFFWIYFYSFLRQPLLDVFCWIFIVGFYFNLTNFISYLQNSFFFQLKIYSTRAKRTKWCFVIYTITFGSWVYTSSMKQNKLIGISQWENYGFVMLLLFLFLHYFYLNAVISLVLLFAYNIIIVLFSIKWLLTSVQISFRNNFFSILMHYHRYHSLDVYFLCIMMIFILM